MISFKQKGFLRVLKGFFFQNYIFLASPDKMFESCVFVKTKSCQLHTFECVKKDLIK